MTLETRSKNAIEQQVGIGNWDGITVDVGRFEGRLVTVDIGPNTIETKKVNLDAGTITVIASD